VVTIFDPKLGVLVTGDEIVVVLAGSIYTVTYREASRQRTGQLI